MAVDKDKTGAEEEAERSGAGDAEDGGGECEGCEEADEEECKEWRGFEGDLEVADVVLAEDLYV